MKTINKTVHFDIRYLIAILSVVLIIGGFYFKFLYDVPDGEETTNLWTSWLMIVLGIVGIMISILHKKRRASMIEDFDDNNYDNDVDYNTNERGAFDRP
jgi:H+/Cl- antiporter ClcA